jgi:hypothetical protein
MKRTQIVSFNTASGDEIEVKDHPENHIAVGISAKNAKRISVYINTPKPHADRDIAVCVNGEWLKVAYPQ